MSHSPSVNVQACLTRFYVEVVVRYAMSREPPKPASEVASYVIGLSDKGISRILLVTLTTSQSMATTR
jgi:hypothetical protein